MTQILPLEILVVPTGNLDANAIQALNFKLRTELYATAVESAEFSASPILTDSPKGLENLDWSSLLVTLASSRPALMGLFRTLQKWIDRNDARLVLTAPNGTTLHLEGDLDDIDLPELVNQFQLSVQQEGGVDIVVENGGRLRVDGDIVGGNQHNVHQHDRCNGSSA